MGGGKGGSDASDTAGATAAANEAARQTAITQGTNRTNKVFDSQFTPDYYQKIASGYQDYADPQLDQQFKTAQQQLSYGLARDGNLNSSTSADQQANLQSQYNTNKTAIANQGQTLAQNAQTSVEAARQNLISSLQTTSDAAGSANNAAAQATALATPPSYSALGSLFSTTTSALATQAAAERAQALSGGIYTAPYNTGAFA